MLFPLRHWLPLQVLDLAACPLSQFLCVTFRRANPSFLDALQMSLQHVPKAAREKSVHLKSCIQAFRKEVDFAEREVSLMPEDQLSEVTPGLLKDLHAQAFELENSLAMAFGKCEEAQEYLCTSEDKANDAAPPPYENLFLHLSDFLESFRKAWRRRNLFPVRKIEYSLSTRHASSGNLPRSSRRR